MQLPAATVRSQLNPDRPMQFTLPLEDVHGHGLHQWLLICLTLVPSPLEQYSLVTVAGESDPEIEEAAPSPNPILELSGQASAQARTRMPLAAVPRLVNAGGSRPRPSRSSGSVPGAGVVDWAFMSSPLVENCPTSPSSLGVETCSAESLETGASPMSALTEQPEATEDAEMLFTPQVEEPQGRGDAENQGEDRSCSGENADAVAPQGMEQGSRGNARVEEVAAEAEDVRTSTGAERMEVQAVASEVLTSTGQAVVPAVASGASQWNGLDFSDLLESIADQEAALLANRPQLTGGALAVLRYGYDIATRTFPSVQIFDSGPEKITRDLAKRAYGAAQIWCRTMELGIEHVEKCLRLDPPKADVQMLERQRGILMLADLVRQFLDIVRGGKMVHFMLVAHAQQQGWVPYMHEQAASPGFR